MLWILWFSPARTSGRSNRTSDVFNLTAYNVTTKTILPLDPFAASSLTLLRANSHMTLIALHLGHCRKLLFHTSQCTSSVVMTRFMLSWWRLRFQTWEHKIRLFGLRLRDLHMLQTPFLQVFGAPKILFPWNLQRDWVHPELFRLCLITRKVLLVVSDANIGLISSVLAVLPVYLFEVFCFFLL